MLCKYVIYSRDAFHEGILNFFIANRKLCRYLKLSQLAKTLSNMRLPMYLILMLTLMKAWKLVKN